MFGHHRMTHEGTAKVVSCELHPGGWSTTDSQGRSTTKFDLILDVVPDGAPPFRTDARQSFSELRFPDPGDSLRVRCNPEQHTVEIDLSEDMRFNPKLFRRESEIKRKEDHDRILNAAPGTPASGGDGAIDDPELDPMAWVGPCRVDRRGW